MMEIPEYQETSLWKRTLGSSDPKVARLRESYLKTRETVAYLLEKIREDFDFLTIHDISHVDSLWDVADTIIGKDYPINPLEGYILGISFLIHDVALSYETFGGVDSLRKTVQWLDAHAGGCPKGMKNKDFLKECDFTAIRLLHAQRAGTILEDLFKRRDGSKFYILEDEELRTHFGPSIGKIAASHHWEIDEVETDLRPQINPMHGMPKSWTVYAHKLSCILRCADAGHIDNGRAPDKLYRSMHINGVPRNHWEAQNHLCVVCKDMADPTKLCITSSHPFPKSEAAAWSVAYDAICQFDDEIKKANSLLKKLKMDAFPYDGVSGAFSRETLKKYVQTKGWEPCDIAVRASNVKTLIESLGGTQLYGNSAPLLVVLRELIQNSRDAIHARGSQDDDYSIDDGKIVIRLKDEKRKRFIEIEDNGIGMSLDCIKHYLLNFGSSYWESPLSKKENPGLRSSNFLPIGKFGIGFYSVFMVAESVMVITRRRVPINNSRKKNSEEGVMCLEFPKGLTLTPIMSNESQGLTMSTLIRFELKKDYWKLSRLWEDTDESKDISIDLHEIIPVIVAGLDANVYYGSDKGKDRIHTSIISPRFDRGKWLENLCKSAFGEIEEIKQIAPQLKFLVDEHDVVRGLVAPPISKETGSFLPCIETFRGLYSSSSFKDAFLRSGHFLPYIGYLDFKEGHISRGRVEPDSSLKKCLRVWARKEYFEHHKLILNSDCVANNFANLTRLCDVDEEVVSDNALSLYLDQAYLSELSFNTIGYIRFIRDSLLRGTSLMLDSVNYDRLNLAIQKWFPDFSIEKKDELPFNSSTSDKSSEDFINLYYHIRLEGILELRVLEVWLNLMLHNSVPAKMIDWEKAQINRRFPRLDKITKSDLVVYLRKFLIPTDLYLDRLSQRIR